MKGDISLEWSRLTDNASRRVSQYHYCTGELETPVGGWANGYENCRSTLGVGTVQRKPISSAPVECSILAPTRLCT